MWEILKKYKYIILFFVIVIALFTYCGLNTFAASDDLPYSLYYRGTERITTLKQIYYNQKSDYLTINGRFIVHSVVQFVLMYGKILFSILNGIVIAITLFFSLKICNLKSKEKRLNDIFILIFMLGCILLLGNYKYLIYWVAGSVNYIWLLALILMFCYYYLKVGLQKHKILNCIIFFFLSVLHECSFVFVLLLIASDVLKDIIEKRKMMNFKEMLPYLLYIIFTILGGLIIIKSPGNIHRMANAQAWYNLSFFERITTSIPVVSKNLLLLFNINNLLPTIFLGIFIVYGFKFKQNLVKIITAMVLVSAIISFITANGWLYFILAILIFLNFMIMNYINQENDMNALTIAFYAVSFSMIITPEYAGARPNYYMYIWMIISICIYLNRIIKSKKIIYVVQLISVILVLFTGFAEYKIYTYIGNLHRERLKQIQFVKENNLKVLKCKKMDEKYAKYHADANCPQTGYWAYRYFLYYYNLPDDLTVELID